MQQELINWMMNKLESVFRFFVILTGILLMVSCADDLMDVNPDERETERRVLVANDPETATKMLGRAQAEGKVIESIVPVRNNASGWKIRFTDGTIYRFMHAELLDSTQRTQRSTINVPSYYLYVDLDSMWSHIDPQDNIFSRIADLYTVAHQVSQFFNYSSGKKAVDGYELVLEKWDDDCPRFARLVNSLHYRGMQCDRQTDAIVTSCSYLWRHFNGYETHFVVSCIVENMLTQETTIYLENDTTFTFKKAYPQIQRLMVDPIAVNSFVEVVRDSSVAVDFSVTPAEALFSHNVDGDDVDIRLVCLDYGEAQPSTHVRLAGVSHKLIEEHHSTDMSMEKGGYTVTIQDIGTGETYSEKVALELSVRDNSGMLRTLRSEPFIVKSVERWLKTNLPVVYIDTPNGKEINSREVWMKGTTVKICQPDGVVDYEGTTSIRGRGNSTWGPPKKPYSLKLDKKSSILGMPADKRWCLLAGWFDRTLIRNAVAMKIAEIVDMDWVPRGRFVELVLNGTHKGCYYLCEKVKVGSNRVNIHEMTSGDNSGEALTGGYLAELDTYYDEGSRFRSVIKNFPYMIHDPNEDDITNEQFQYFQNYINNLESALYDKTRFEKREYRDLIDFDSFIKFWLVCELTNNSEISSPKSVYVYKDRGGKLKAGPAWDYDYGTFLPIQTYCAKTSYYYDALFKDPMFVDRTKELFSMHYDELITLYMGKTLTIDSISKEVELSDRINYLMWPNNVECPNGDEELPYHEAVKRLKDAYRKKLFWLRNQLQNL